MQQEERYLVWEAIRFLNCRCIFEKNDCVKYWKFFLGFILIFTLSLSAAEAQAKKTKKLGVFQRNRVAFQKNRYGQTSKKYGKACDIFEKKRTKGAKKPIFSFLGRRKSKNKKVAEQN
jgi:hypothetical protein